MSKFESLVCRTSEKELGELAIQMAKELFSCDFFYIELFGEIGVGKTFFSKVFITEWLRLAEPESHPQITSPSFPLARVYGKVKRVAHLDLYRLNSFSELESIGYETYLYESAGMLLEWPNRFGSESEMLRPKWGPGERKNMRMYRVNLYFSESDTQRLVEIRSIDSSEMK